MRLYWPSAHRRPLRPRPPSLSKSPTVTIPDCTGKNSPLEVLAGSCKLVKGVMIYGDLTSIPTDIAIVPSGATGVSGGL